MTARSNDPLGFAPDDDTPIPYMARTREYYPAIGYTRPIAGRLAGPLPTLGKAARTVARRDRHDGRTFRSRQGRPRPRRQIQWQCQILFGLRRRTSKPHDLRISQSRMTAYTRRLRTAAPGFRCRNCEGWRARGGSAKLPRGFSAPRPTAAIASRSGPRPEIRRLPGDQVTPCWCRTVRSATRPSAGSPGHFEANGISTVVMGCAKDIVNTPACRGSCSPIFRSAIRPASRTILRPRRSRLNWPARAGSGALGANHGPVAAALEHGRRWKRDYSNIAARAPRNWRRRPNSTPKRKSLAACAKPRPAPPPPQPPPRAGSDPGCAKAIPD